MLFEATHSVKDTERLVNAFNNTQRSQELVKFLKENSGQLSQSSLLRMSYAWGLYHEGAFLESRTALLDLHDEVGSPNHRALQVNLGIATGDWLSLFAFIADEYQQRSERSSHELIRTAKLALYLGSPHAKDLVFEAARTADGDPAVLTAAYLYATSAGWEDNPEVSHWLETAATQSGDNGPLQTMSLRDLLERKPEWDHRTSETWRLLAQGKVPIFLAAQSLNRTLIDLTTFPALANISKTDPRRKSAIPAYSGKRGQLGFDFSGKTVALDATALLTLSFLKILDIAIDACETVYIPHSTLPWLFQERQKAAFHQPSRIANSHKIRDFLATDTLEKLTPGTVANSDLSAQIGDELATLIAEAETLRESDNTQRIVVRSAPVYRLSSLMEEVADLSAHEAVLSSCLAVIEKLRQKGQLTVEEEKRARTYLQLHEKPWPNQPDIVDKAILYLDDLAVTYFLHLGVLGKLKSAGFKAIVSPSVLSETDALISYERISNDAKDVIEGIQASLSSRIISGKVKVGRRINYDEFEDKSISEDPSLGILTLAPHCDVAIIDDRFLNRHERLDSGNAQVPILSTLDLLDALALSGVLSIGDHLELRTRLRRAGYFFIPINVEELEGCLRASTIAKGAVVETAELKAIRESILNVRMSDWLQLPEEVPWLDRTLKVYSQVLRNLWADEVDLEEAAAHSNWLVEQIDARGWAHRLVPENADNFVRIGWGAYILLLLTPHVSVQQEVADAYWNWLEEKVLTPIQEQFPEVYGSLVDWQLRNVDKMAETRF